MSLFNRSLHLSLCRISVSSIWNDFYVSPQSPSCQTHRWGLSKPTDVLYNKHTHSFKHVLMLRLACRVQERAKSVYPDITSDRMSTDGHTNVRVALWAHDGSAAWRGHAEGQPGKDRWRWWCTSARGPWEFPPGAGGGGVCWQKLKLRIKRTIRDIWCFDSYKYNLSQNNKVQLVL